MTCKNFCPSDVFAQSPEPVLALAPMEPDTASPIVRELAGHQGAVLVCRPKILSQHLLKAKKWQFRERLQNPETLETIQGTPVYDGIQLIARPGDPIRQAVQFIEKWQENLGVQYIDLNFACPRSSVVKSGRGGGLLRHPGKVKQVFEEVRAHTTLPVSAKIRTGFTITDHPRAVCEVLADAGVAWITVNRVPVKFGYKVTQEVRDAFKGVRSAVEAVNRKVPIVGNGGIDTPKDARKFLKKTGCSGLMVGRAALGNPAIFRQIHASFAESAPTRTNDKDSYLPIPVESQVRDLFATIVEYARGGQTAWSTIGQVKRLVYPYLATLWACQGGKVPPGCGRAKWPKKYFSWDSLQDFLHQELPKVKKTAWNDWFGVLSKS